MKPSKERPSIGTRRGKGEGDLDIRGEELSTMRHKNWNEVKRMAGNRAKWRCFVDALCPLRDDRH